jgi:hypothetical protein
MDQLTDASDYALLAFVGDECRGVGSCAKGRFFITVQCDAGERISFRLCHLSSGRQAGVSETLRADGQPRQGSLRRPVVLHTPEAITGIAPVATDKMSTTYYYDLSGRRRATARAGVVIERRADGSTRLVVR